MDGWQVSQDGNSLLSDGKEVADYKPSPRSVQVDCALLFFRILPEQKFSCLTPSNSFGCSTGAHSCWLDKAQINRKQTRSNSSGKVPCCLS